jgi:hypothetical protein
MSDELILEGIKAEPKEAVNVEGGMFFRLSIFGGMAPEQPKRFDAKWERLRAAPFATYDEIDAWLNEQGPRLVRENIVAVRVLRVEHYRAVRPLVLWEQVEARAVRSQFPKNPKPSGVLEGDEWKIAKPDEED